MKNVSSADMSISTIDRINEIQQKASQEIADLRQQAAAEILARVAALRGELDSLAVQYAALTEKPLPGADTALEEKKSRRRLSTDEKAALVETVRNILAAKPQGAKMSEIVSEAGESVAAVRDALSRIKTKTTGAKATTRYFLK